MASSKKPGNKRIKAGKKKLEKGILGSRTYNILSGTKDIYEGEKSNRKTKRKSK